MLFSISHIQKAMVTATIMQDLPLNLPFYPNINENRRKKKNIKKDE